MKKIEGIKTVFSFVLIFFFLAGCGIESLKLPEIEGKRILMVIARENFRDEELLEPKRIFEAKGAEVTVASESLDEAEGMLGASVKPDVTLRDFDAAEYDAVVFVGGSGAKSLWDDEEAHKIARETFDKGKVLGAICVAPVILARAGVLEYLDATVFPSEAGKITEEGAVYVDKDVVRDGNVITAEGPKAAKKFAAEIVKALAKTEEGETKGPDPFLDSSGRVIRGTPF